MISKEILYYICLYKKNLQNNFKIYQEYKLDFFIGLFSIFFQLIIFLLFFEIYFHKFKAFPNWNKEELIFMYSLNIIVIGIYNMFFQNMWSIGWFYIRQGELDYLMVRPLNILFQIICKKFLFENIILIFSGFFFLFYSLCKLKIEISFFLVIKIFIILISGVIIIFSINLFFLSLSFWIDDSTFIALSIYNLKEYGRFPIKIFPKIIRYILTFLLPYSFTSYYPSLNFLNKQETRFNYIFFTLLVAFILLNFSYKFWNIGIKRYSSTN
ncbi:ABC-2 family transporter protein [Fusobacterium nucleatum]